jgi:hypothetical protein
MRFDVVNIRRPDPKSMLAALPAEGFLQQLSGAAFRPVIPGIRVQMMPGSGFLASDLGLVGRTVPITSDHPAPRMLALA